MKQTITTILATVTLGMFLACGGAGNTPKRQGTAESSSNPTVSKSTTTEPEQLNESAAADAYMVRVAVHDDTQNRPLHPKAEVWFRGRGSWWIKEATKFGSAAEKLAEREPNKKDTIHLYPDGRDGKEIIIPIMMTTEMISGSVQDTVNIDIADDVVTAGGNPVKAATGESEIKFKR